LRAVRLGLVALAAAAGGSICGGALIAGPSLIFGSADDAWFVMSIAALVSLPFTLAGTAILTGLALLWSGSLSGRWADYGGIVLAAVLVGALMPVPLFGAAGLFPGAIFGALTAACWAALYSRFARPGDLREAGHG
jgi:hypothetical protein